MNEDRLERLLWERFDGAIGAEDLEELEAYLADHPEARDEESQLTVLAQLLAEVEEVEPPAILRQRIDERLAASTAPRSRAPSFLAAVGELFATPQRLRWAYLAAGLILGVSGYHILSTAFAARQPMDVSRLYGSMNTEHVAQAPAEPVRLPALEADLTLARDGSRLVTKLRKRSTAVADIVLETAGAGLAVETVEHLGGTLTRVRPQAQGLTVEIAGPGEVLLVARLHKPGHPVRLRISSQGEVLLERSVLLENLPEIAAPATNF